MIGYGNLWVGKRGRRMNGDIDVQIESALDKAPTLVRSLDLVVARVNPRDGLPAAIEWVESPSYEPPVSG